MRSLYLRLAPKEVFRIELFLTFLILRLFAKKLERFAPITSRLPQWGRINVQSSVILGKYLSFYISPALNEADICTIFCLISTCAHAKSPSTPKTDFPEIYRSTPTTPGFFRSFHLNSR
jgi:hypothetical protein